MKSHITNVNPCVEFRSIQSYHERVKVKASQFGAPKI